MHTARGSLRLRSRGAHCDPELARQDRRSRLARKEARRKEEGGGRGGGGGGGGGRTAVIKSNNSHLAGGEKRQYDKWLNIGNCTAMDSMDRNAFYTAHSIDPKSFNVANTSMDPVSPQLRPASMDRTVSTQRATCVAEVEKRTWEDSRHV